MSLVKKFEKLTNIGAALNTSFNLSGFPKCIYTLRRNRNSFKLWIRIFSTRKFCFEKIKN